MNDDFAYPYPVGVNIPLASETQPIRKVQNGERLTFRARASWAAGVPATPHNSILRFVLGVELFDSRPVWTGVWGNGILPVDLSGDMVEVTVPDSVSATLRRGSFIYALRMTDRLGANAKVLVRGSLLVEYDPTSPCHDVPYDDHGREHGHKCEPEWYDECGASPNCVEPCVCSGFCDTPYWTLRDPPYSSHYIPLYMGWAGVGGEAQ